MDKNFELKSLIGSKFLGGSSVSNTFKVMTDDKERSFAVECYAPTPRGNFFSFAHCYNAILKNDTDRIIADVIYDGETEYSFMSTNTNVTFVNAKGEVLYSIFAYEGQHTAEAPIHYGKVYVREISGLTLIGEEELV